MRVKLAAVVLSIAALLSGMSHTASKNTAKIEAAKTVKPKLADPIQTRLNNCENHDFQPCYTFDEGKWRIVYSYEPYTAKAVVLCGAEDGGPILPCLAKRENKNGEGARNYFWRSTF